MTPATNIQKPQRYILGRYSKVATIKNRILLFLRETKSFFKYGKIYFLDTNMLIYSAAPDSRWRKLFTLNHNYWVSEQIKKEIDASTPDKKYRKYFDRSLKILSFGNLRELYPNTCPLYYNYILSMHNPAIILRDNFDSERIVNSLIKNGALTKEEDKLNQYASQRIAGRKFPDTPDANLITLIRKLEINTMSKKRKAIKNKNDNYFNDLKNISLSLLFCLQKRKNVTFITSDGDAIINIQDLFDDAIQQMTFRHFILPQLDDNKKIELIKGGCIMFTLDSFQFVFTRDGFKGDAFCDDYKKDFLTFSIKYWDIPSQKYISFVFRFDEATRSILLNSHGRFFCPNAKNDDMGNWLTYKYWWPPNPITDIMTLKVEVGAKKGLVRKDTFVTDNFHRTHCYYPTADSEGKLFSLSGFHRM